MRARQALCLETVEMLECCWEVWLPAHRLCIQCPTLWSLQSHWLCGPDFSQCADWCGIFYRLPQPPTPRSPAPRKLCLCARHQCAAGLCYSVGSSFPPVICPPSPPITGRERIAGRERAPNVIASSFLFVCLLAWLVSWFVCFFFEHHS